MWTQDCSFLENMDQEEIRIYTHTYVYGHMHIHTCVSKQDTYFFPLIKKQNLQNSSWFPFYLIFTFPFIPFVILPTSIPPIITTSYFFFASKSCLPALNKVMSMC